MTVPAPLSAKSEKLGADLVRIDLPFGAHVQPTGREADVAWLQEVEGARARGDDRRFALTEALPSNAAVAAVNDATPVVTGRLR